MLTNGVMQTLHEKRLAGNLAKDLVTEMTELPLEEKVSDARYDVVSPFIPPSPIP